jgi:hypothetical protein
MVLQKILKVYMLYLQKRFRFLLTSVFIVYSQIGHSQKPVKEFFKDSIYIANDIFLLKTYPIEYKEAISTVLNYFPDLNLTKIKFRVKKKITPLSARPTVFSAFRKPAHRKYLVTIIWGLKPIVLKQI